MVPVLQKLLGASLAAQWLRLPASTAVGAGSNPVWGAKIPDAEQHDKKKKKKNRFKLKPGQEDRCSVHVPGTQDGCSDHELLLVKNHFGQITLLLKSVPLLSGSPEYNPASFTWPPRPSFPQMPFSANFSTLPKSTQ